MPIHQILPGITSKSKNTERLVLQVQLEGSLESLRALFLHGDASSYVTYQEEIIIELPENYLGSKTDRRG